MYNFCQALFLYIVQFLIFTFLIMWCIILFERRCAN
nr:MAG TPA: hypothetical protein [Caudoviricetes sp.]